MGQHVKAICIGSGYAFLFHLFGWAAAVLNVGDFLSPIPGAVLFCAVMLALAPAYFFALARVERRWTFRCAALLLFALLCVLAFFLITQLGADLIRNLEYLVFGYVMVQAMVVIFALDALILVVRYLKRQLRDRFA